MSVIAVIDALAILVQLMQTATGAMTAAMQISELIKKAKEENRDITVEELAAITIQDDLARQKLEDAIKAAGEVT